MCCTESSRRLHVEKHIAKLICLRISTILRAIAWTGLVAIAQRNRVSRSDIGAPTLKTLNDGESIVILAVSRTPPIRLILPVCAISVRRVRARTIGEVDCKHPTEEKGDDAKPSCKGPCSALRSHLQHQAGVCSEITQDWKLFPPNLILLS